MDHPKTAKRVQHHICAIGTIICEQKKIRHADRAVMSDPFQDMRTLVAQGGNQQYSHAVALLPLSVIAFLCRIRVSLCIVSNIA